MASSCEIVEIQVLAPAGAGEVRSRLAEALPPELPVFRAEEVPEGERLRMEAATYEARPREGGPPLPPGEAADALLSLERVPVERRGKSVDLRPLLRELRREGESLRMRLGFHEGGATARPEDVMGALGADPRGYLYERTGMVVRLQQAGGPETERSYGP